MFHLSSRGWGYPFKDFIVGDYIIIAPVNPFTSKVDSANKGASVQKRVDSKVRNLTINVQKLSNDDKFLNGVMNSQTTQILEGSLKSKFMINGSSRIENYILEIGTIIDTPTDTRNNQEVNATMSYVIEFRNTDRIF